MADSDPSVIVHLHTATWETDVPEKDPETGSRAPGEGTCRRCGERKQLNRLRLCYRCWVYCEIERVEGKKGLVWRPGMPHPDWCACVLPEHVRSENPGPEARSN